MKNKRAVSDVVAVVLLIALVMVTGAIVWGVVNNLVKDKLEGAGSCIDIFEKLSLNGRYTCFDGGNNRVAFSISRGDIDLDSVIVLISNAGTTSNFKLTSTSETVSGLQLYNGSTTIWLPGKNEGLTYYCTSTVCTSLQKSLEIAPVVGGKQCNILDSITEIPTCLELGV